MGVTITKYFLELAPRHGGKTAKAVVPCQNKIILKNFRSEPPPSVDRLKIILFQHGTTSKIILKNFMLYGTTSKIILKNFSINIHEAVLQPIAAFVYCNFHAAHFS